MSLVHGMSTVAKHDEWSYKSKKRDGHVFYMATPCHATESIGSKKNVTFVINEGKGLCLEPILIPWQDCYPPQKVRILGIVI